MDEVGSLISEIENDRSITEIRFAASFLDNVANVYEKYGAGVAKVFLREKQSRRELSKQATALLRVLDKLGKYPKVRTNRRIGRLVIKTMRTISRTKSRR